MSTQSDGAADYNYWLKVRVWTAREAAALFLGFEPEYTEHSFLGPLEDRSEDLARSAIRAQRNALEKVLESAQLAGELGKVKLNQVGRPWGNNVTWKKWVDWASKNNISWPDRLREALDSVVDERPDSASAQNLHPRRETTLLRIIGALLHVTKQATEISEANLIDQINDLFGQVPGIAVSTLQRDFAEAKRRLSDY